MTPDTIYKSLETVRKELAKEHSLPPHNKRNPRTELKQNSEKVRANKGPTH